MGMPLPTGGALEAVATRKHEQQLHWEYALQLLKDLEAVLPLRIESARVVRRRWNHVSFTNVLLTQRLGARQCCSRL